jgi:hypothetical protein
MANKILCAFLAADAVFVLGGGLLLAVALISKANINSGESLQKVAEMILLSQCPLNGSCTWFLPSLFYLPQSRHLAHVHI